MMMDNIKQILNETGRTISNKDRGLASMMDNEPRFEGRSPEDQIFAIEAEIENMMRSYETAVRDGDTDRAQFIADVIDKMEQMKMERKRFISREGDPMSPNLSMPNIYNYRLRKSLESGDPNVIRSEQRDIRRSAIRDMDMIQNSGMMQEDPDYANEIMQMLEGIRGNYAGGGEAEFTPPTIQELISKSGMVLTNSDREIIGKLTEQGVDAKLIYRYLLENKKKESVQQFPMMMAEGGEAQMQMSEQEAMAELEAAGPDFEIVEQLIGAVVQMIQQGVSEAEVREFLKEQGLDDEDIEELFKMVMERLQQATAEEPIGKELQGIM